MGALNGIHVGKLINKTLLRRGAYLKDSTKIGSLLYANSPE